MSKRDYYDVLGVSRGADAEEIKNRVIAMKMRNLDQISKIIADGQQKKQAGDDRRNA